MKMSLDVGDKYGVDHSSLERNDVFIPSFVGDIVAISAKSFLDALVGRIRIGKGLLNELDFVLFDHGCGGRWGFSFLYLWESRSAA
jgi:hypothetical protein